MPERILIKSLLSASAAVQKEEVQAKAQKAKEAEEAQKKLADMMVEAQKKVLLTLATPHLICLVSQFASLKIFFPGHSGCT